MNMLKNIIEEDRVITLGSKLLIVAIGCAILAASIADIAF